MNRAAGTLLAGTALTRSTCGYRASGSSGKPCWQGFCRVTSKHSGQQQQSLQGFDLRKSWSQIQKQPEGQRTMPEAGQWEVDSDPQVATIKPGQNKQWFKAWVSAKAGKNPIGVGLPEGKFSVHTAQVDHRQNHGLTGLRCQWQWKSGYKIKFWERGTAKGRNPGYLKQRHPKLW